MSKFFIFYILFLFTSYSDSKPDYSKMARGIVANYIKDFAQPRGLVLYTYGGGMMYDIEKITLSFYCFDALNVDEARILYIDLMEKLLHYFNSNKEIRPYLHMFPFGVDNIELSISFVDSQCLTKKNGSLTYIFIERNQELFYKAYSSDTDGFYTLHREPYAEALKQVTNQDA